MTHRPSHCKGVRSPFLALRKGLSGAPAPCPGRGGHVKTGPMPDQAPPPKLHTKEAFLAWLEAHGIPHETRHHEALHTVEEAQAARAGWGAPWTTGGHCKNLFLKDKKGALYLIVTLEERALKLNRLSKPLGSARLSFANADLLWEKLGVRPGSVTPFAVVNDAPAEVRVVLDEPMLAHERLHYHPLENTATTAIAREELLRLLRLTHHEPIILDLVEAQGGDESGDEGGGGDEAAQS